MLLAGKKYLLLKRITLCGENFTQWLLYCRICSFPVIRHIQSNDLFGNPVWYLMWSRPFDSPHPAQDTSLRTSTPFHGTLPPRMEHGGDEYGDHIACPLLCVGRRSNGYCEHRMLGCKFFTNCSEKKPRVWFLISELASDCFSIWLSFSCCE